MKLTDMNRAGGIGSNCMLAEIGPFRIVIDCGMHPKRIGKEALPALDKIPPGSIDFVVLTHCHLDHLGGLPVLLRSQPEAQLLMSLPSRVLAPRMLHNSVNVMRRQRDELGIAEYPFYSHGEIERMEENIMPMAFDRPRTFHLYGEDIEFTFYPAGHIAGAAACRIVYKHRKIFFTGDVLFTEQKILPGARFPKEEWDTLVMETTRGASGRTSDYSRDEETTRLLATVNHVISHGGSILIPVFALGRMQEILTVLNDARKEGNLPDCPIFCSGLGMDVANHFDEIARKTGLVRFRRRVFKDLKASKLPNKIPPGKPPARPSIFVVSSGMLVEHTPSYKVAASLMHEARNAICFVGYCDPDTPGGKVLETNHGDDFLFEKLDYACKINCSIERYDLSGHADREELLAFALAANPRAVVLTHGDPEARDWFHDELAMAGGNMKILDPTPLTTYDV